MKSKKILRGRPGREEPPALCSLDIITGARNVTQLSPEDLCNRERPEDLRDMHLQARHWDTVNWFVEQARLLKSAFYNFGLRIVAAERGDREKVKAWLQEIGHREAVHRYIQSVWEEWLLQDTVVSFWRKGLGSRPGVTPFLLLAETCQYSDAMGVEKLKVRLGYKPEQLKESGLSAADIKRYTSGEIVLTPETAEKYDEWFKVLTRGHKGHGFGVPRLFRVFRTCSQAESQEVQESMLAYGGRLVLRFHQFGFEVKSGSNAAKQAEYLWKKKRADAVEKFFRGRQGFAETTGQFDHKINYVTVDPKLYGDGKQWQSVLQRLLWWAGPVGWMVLAKSVSPFLLDMLKGQALEDRRRVGLHLEWVINEGFGNGSEELEKLPARVKVEWSNRIFKDARLAWDMVKTLMQQGPLSLQTALEQADFDAEEEGERKVIEAPEKVNDRYLPKFDPNHGNRPGQAGRKAGSKDGEVVK